MSLKYFIKMITFLAIVITPIALLLEIMRCLLKAIK